MPQDWSGIVKPQTSEAAISGINKRKQSRQRDLMNTAHDSVLLGLFARWYSPTIMWDVDYEGAARRHVPENKLAKAKNPQSAYQLRGYALIYAAEGVTIYPIYAPLGMDAATIEQKICDYWQAPHSLEVWNAAE